MLKADLEREVRRLTTQLDLKKTEVDALKASHQKHLGEIGRKAMELAEEHDWCSVASDALEELGVPIPVREVAMKVILHVRAKTLGGGTSTGEMQEWAENSFALDTENLRLFDSDWSDVKIESMTVEGVNIQ